MVPSYVEEESSGTMYLLIEYPTCTATTCVAGQQIRLTIDTASPYALNVGASKHDLQKTAQRTGRLHNIHHPTLKTPVGTRSRRYEKR